MNEKIREAIRELVRLKWITLNENIQEGAIVMLVESFIKKMSVVDFIRWTKGF